jgi:hypothetical protein
VHSLYSGSAYSLSRPHDHTQTHHTGAGLLWTRGQPETEPSTEQHTTLTRHKTSMLPAGFEPAIPANERPHTHALYLAATGIRRTFYFHIHSCSADRSSRFPTNGTELLPHYTTWQPRIQHSSYSPRKPEGSHTVHIRRSVVHIMLSVVLACTAKTITYSRIQYDVEAATTAAHI